jgi:iron complex transport system ATP-binding protein
MPPPVLAVTDLTFRRGRPILHGITWAVQRGEHWAVLGPNGCGKTTLINIITGYDCATSGTIDVDGSRFGDADWREVRKRVGIVASTLVTLLESSEPVLDVIASGRDAKLNLIEAVPEAQRREARKLLQRIGCAHLADARWGTLSQGERQKILICRALMAKFRVLILDEPCAGLDPVAREHFLQWLAQVAEQPHAPSLVMVTHHVEEILPCITHVLVLRGGKALANGPKAKTLTSARLSEAYGAPVKLSRRGPRYSLAVG